MLIFVAGMHRSGTSLLTQLLKEAGATVPGDLLPKTPDNPKGYWEPREVVGLNNQILAAADRSWCDDREIPNAMIGRLRESHLAQIKHCLSGLYQQGTLTALKDPRLSVLLPLWLAAADEMTIETCVVVCLRNPVETALSLFQRLHEPMFRPAALLSGTKAYALSARYMIEAERHSRHINRSFVSHEDLLRAPLKEIQRCIRTANIPLNITEDKLAARVNLATDTSLHRMRDQGATNGLSASADFATDLFDKLRKLTCTDDEDSKAEVFDAARKQFNRLTASTDTKRGKAASHPHENSAALAELEKCFGSAHADIQDTKNRARVVTFVSGEPNSKGDKYRVKYRLEALIASPFAGACANLVEDDPTDIVNASDLIVVFRKEWSEDLRKLYGLAQSASVPVIFDIDDLIFDPDYMVPDYIALLSGFDPSKQAHWQAKAENYNAALTQADSVWTTTKALAHHAARFNPNTHVLPNGISIGRNRRAAALLQKAGTQVSKPPCDDQVRIGYAAGTPTHDRDFEIVAPVLAKLLAEHAHLRLVLLGHIRADKFPCLDAHRDQVETVPAVEFEYLPDELIKVDINVAPLEANNPFCDAKSELKFFESAIVEVPTVASATSTFQDAILHGQTGFLASSADDWHTHLSNLIGDPSLRTRIGAAARKDALSRYGPDAQKTALLGAIRRHLQD